MLVRPNFWTGLEVDGVISDSLSMSGPSFHDLSWYLFFKMFIFETNTNELLVISSDNS